MGNEVQSPFSSNNPVQIETFVGREAETERLLGYLREGQQGRPAAVFLSGESGIGKSSLANILRVWAAKKHRMLTAHVLLGGKKTTDAALEVVYAKLIEELVRDQASGSKFQKIFRDYINEVKLFGVSIKTDKLRHDVPDLARGFLPFLRELRDKTRDTHDGIYLVLDDINGIAKSDDFAPFLKSLIDENGMDRKAVPLFLVLCGLPERLSDLEAVHHPVLRSLKEVVHLDPIPDGTVRKFFVDTFKQVDMTVDDASMFWLVHGSKGLPKLMHLLGEHVFYAARKAHTKAVTHEVAVDGLFGAANEIGTKFVDSKIVAALRSTDYKNMLEKLCADMNIAQLTWKRKEASKLLNASERAKFDNFLQRLKGLGVIEPGAAQGEWIFKDTLTAVYLWLTSFKIQNATAGDLPPP